MRPILATITVLLLSLATFAQTGRQSFDVIIRNGEVYDGTGAKPRRQRWKDRAESAD